MVNTLLRRTGIISLALLLCVGVLLVLIFLTHTLTLYATPPSALLPAEPTLALFTNLTDDDRKKVESLLPANFTIPPADAAALLMLPNSGTGWILFSKKETPASVRIGRWYIHFSDPRLEIFLSDGSVRVSQLQSFRELTDQRDDTDRWAYLSPLLTRDFTGTLAVFSPTLSEKVLHFEDGAITIDTFVRTPVEKKGIDETIARTLQKNTLTLRTNDIALLLSKIKREIPSQELLQIEGLLHQKIATLFGPDVSVNYDILPLFSHQATLHIGMSASGHTLLALEGAITQGASQALQKLHTEAMQGESKTKIVYDTLSTRDRSARVQKQESSEFRELDIDRWTVRESDSGLWSALRGTSVIIASSSEAGMQLLKNKNSLVLPTTHSVTQETLLSGGEIDPAMLTQLLKEVLLIEDIDLPLRMNEKENIEWTETQQDNIHSLKVRWVQ